MSEQLTVAGLAARVGVSPDAVRFYERLGLLPHRRAARPAIAATTRVRWRGCGWSRGAQRVGLRLREIAELLQVVDRGRCPCGHTEALLHQRLAEVDAELARLGELRDELARLLTQAPGEACTVETTEGWWCVQAFSSKGGDGDGGVPELRLPMR